MKLMRERELYYEAGGNSCFGANVHLCALVVLRGSCLRQWMLKAQ